MRIHHIIGKIFIAMKKLERPSHNYTIFSFSAFSTASVLEFTCNFS